jgi:hypothetical protein
MCPVFSLRLFCLMFWACCCQIRKYGHGSWATPVDMLQAAPGDEQELDEFRRELKDLIIELQQVGLGQVHGVGPHMASCIRWILCE